MAPHLKLVEDLPVGGFPEPLPSAPQATSKLAEVIRADVKKLGTSKLDETRLEACGILLSEKLPPTKSAEAVKAWFQAYRDGDKVTPLFEIILGLADEVEDLDVVKPVSFCLGYEPSTAQKPSTPMFSTYWSGVDVLSTTVEHRHEKTFLTVVDRALMIALTILGLA